MRFLPLTEEEIDFAGKQEYFKKVPVTEKNIQKDIPKDMVSFRSGESDVIKDIPKSSARHPLCPVHGKGFFEIEKYSTDRELHTAHYKHIFHRMEKKLLSDIALENDADIVGYAAPVRKLFHTFASNALVHNPAAYIYPKNNVLFTCSGYDANPKISERKAIMEGIERFSAFSPIDPHNSLIINGSFSHDIPGPSIPLHPESYNEYDKNTTSEILAYNIAKDSCEPLPLEYFFLIDKKKYKPSLNYLNSIGCAAHLSPIHAANSAILELIERDALMRLWLFRYIPQAYVLEDAMVDLSMDIS
ncbi:YcaO-like family protein, partial [Candidatus Gracilibacteria bacterium]|nr:YcaO-like family protein [Candidatus Gracilibacteria bacterium]